MQFSNNGIKQIPQHIAVIMDGNGRWAKSRGLSRSEGHRAGTKTVKMLVEESRKQGVKYLSLFAFSTENWSRPEDEVQSLFEIFSSYLYSEQDLLLSNDIKLRVIGRLEALPLELKQAINQACEVTKNAKSMQLILALSYGGREEIVDVAKNLALEAVNNKLDPKQISTEVFRSKLYAPDLPDPDLLIRTSGESRISNFLLWQLAYSEIVLTDVLWPEFTSADFYNCLKEYEVRSRRYGLTSEQVNLCHQN